MQPQYQLSNGGDAPADTLPIFNATVQPVTLSSTVSEKDSTLPHTLQLSDEGGNFTLSETM